MSKKQNKWPLDGRVTRSKSIIGTNMEEKLAKGKDSGRAQQGTSGTSAATYAGVTTSPAASTSTVSVQQEVTGQRGVVYFEPIDTGKEYPTQPVELARILTQKRFKDYREVTKIGRFQFKVVVTDAGAENKLKSLNLGSHNLKIHLPRKNSSTILFVKGVPLDFGDEEIKDCITTETEVLEVQRIKRRVKENLVDTSNLRITVAGQKVPRLVKIYGCAFKCELYIFPIRQFQNCWRFGHSAKNALASGGAEFADVATEKRIAESRITAPTAKVSTGPRVRTAQNDEGYKGSWIPCGRSRSDTRKRKKQLSLKRQMGLRDWKRKETKASFRTPPCK